MRKAENKNRQGIRSGWPEDAWSQCARLTMLGRRLAMVEGQLGVVELGETRIRLKTRDGMLAVCGKQLRLQEMSMDAAMISGERIDSASYL